METELLYTIPIRCPKSRKQRQLEHRLRIAENIVTVLLGLGSSAALFWAGWLFGSGALG